MLVDIFLQFSSFEMGLLFLGALGLCALFYWGYWHVVHPDQSVVFKPDANWVVKPYGEVKDKTSLRVMTYNLGWAVGPVQKAVRDKIALQAYLDHLDEVVQVIQQKDADVVLLQEVDVNSSRSHGLDQMAYLQEKLGWTYAAQVPDWKRWIPFEGVWKMHRCLVVLSKYPIVKHAYKKFTFYPNLKRRFLTFLYNPFIWKSCTQHIQVVVGRDTHNIFNVHLSVLSQANRLFQIQDLIDWILQDHLLDNLIIGGDFNFQAQVNARGFKIKAPVNDAPPLALFQKIWQAIAGLQEAFIVSSSTLTDVHQEVTFMGTQRRYDFLFFSEHYLKAHAEVIQDVSASDHLPILVALKYSVQNINKR